MTRSHNSEIEARADFSYIRYSQGWEDTDVVINALQIKESDVCLSIAASGDNSLALLSKSPKKVYACDLNPSQLALVELKVNAIKYLRREEVLELLGYENSERRIALFNEVAPFLNKANREYFESNAKLISKGIARSGKFEKYFAVFRNFVLPLIHRESTVEQLMQPKSYEKRLRFYNDSWNTRAWSLMLTLFFSNKVMGWLGRDPQFFKYVDSSLPAFLEKSIYNALVVQDPSQNPYLQWILFGEYRTALPFWLEAKNYAKIKENIDNLELFNGSIEEFIATNQAVKIDCFNLSDIFEYMSHESFEDALSQLADSANQGARLAYWNMLVPRSADTIDSIHLEKEEDLAQKLYSQNKTFFYTKFCLEVVPSC